MKQVIAAVFLAIAVGPAFSARGGGMDTVADPQECPVGTTPLANYKWQDRHLVRAGWACRTESTQ
jgi:hypothetical protein